MVLFVEEDAARAAVLCPLREEGTFLLEELEAVVGTVANEYAATLFDVELECGVEIGIHALVTEGVGGAAVFRQDPCRCRLQRP